MIKKSSSGKKGASINESGANISKNSQGLLFIEGH